MKIGIISDTHGALDGWTIACERHFCGAALILHAGDVLYHGPRNRLLGDYAPARLAEAIGRCAVPVLAARGNCDSEVDASVLETPLAAPYAFAVLDGRRILVTHGHRTESEEEQDALAKKLRADIFVSGHTHIAKLSRRADTVFINPGSPSLSKRADGRQTVAVLEDREARVLDVYTGEVLARLALD